MPVNCPHCQKEVPLVISKERFDEVNKKAQDLATENGVLQRDASKAASLESELAKTKQTHEIDIALLGAGFTDELDRAFAKLAHERLPAPAEGEKPTVPAWVQSWAADPSQIPGPLRGAYKGAPQETPAAAAPAAPAAPAPAPGAPPPKTTAGAAPASTGAPASLQPGGLREIRLSQGLGAAKEHVAAALAALPDPRGR